MQINNWEKALGIYYNENTASKKRKKNDENTGRIPSFCFIFCENTRLKIFPWNKEYSF